MRIKIISDGTSFRTRVINVDTGEELQYVKSLTWGVDAASKNHLCTATITLYNVPVELDVESSVELENRDGTSVSVLEVEMENRDGTPFRGD